jgi:hypothetical protein
MNRCLNERALLALYTHEGTAVAQAHLRLCVDCAERYKLLVQDLETIGQALEAPPPVSEGRRVLAWRIPWIPAAIACAALLLVALDVAWVRRISPVQVGRRVPSDSVFAADLSNALFATGDANAVPQGVVELSYLDAALDAGHPCTQDRFLAGACDDQLSALLIENE